MKYSILWKILLLSLVLLGKPLAVLAEGSSQNNSVTQAKTQSNEVQKASVNINTANQEELADALVGIGLKRAAAIIEYREKNGAFSSKEDLLEVKGIGNSTLEKNKAIITL